LSAAALEQEIYGIRYQIGFLFFEQRGEWLPLPVCSSAFLIVVNIVNRMMQIISYKQNICALQAFHILAAGYTHWLTHTG
jgi:hypothetical protein